MDEAETAVAATVAHHIGAERTSVASDAKREIAAEDDADVLASLPPPGHTDGPPGVVPPALDYRDEAAIGLPTGGRVRAVRQCKQRNQRCGKKWSGAAGATV